MVATEDDWPAAEDDWPAAEDDWPAAEDDWPVAEIDVAERLERSVLWSLVGTEAAEVARAAEDDCSSARTEEIKLSRMLEIWSVPTTEVVAPAPEEVRDSDGAAEADPAGENADVWSFDGIDELEVTTLAAAVVMTLTPTVRVEAATDEDVVWSLAGMGAVATDVVRSLTAAIEEGLPDVVVVWSFGVTEEVGAPRLDVIIPSLFGSASVEEAPVEEAVWSIAGIVLATAEVSKY